ncbi:hypothetical protein H5410_040890 [Solanum commersonii]|uniref:Uncharacterized protein n=1 Tax=Solanum commersonii TaxID=4109 RepID=A0A9J5XT91_SOLCO|nr:hypothetical protein H5410_040890 [Solanum commersonii]
MAAIIWRICSIAPSCRSPMARTSSRISSISHRISSFLDFAKDPLDSKQCKNSTSSGQFLKHNTEMFLLDYLTNALIPDAPVRRCEGLVVEGTQRGRGRPKKYWGEVIRQDLAQLHLTEDMTLDRKEWRSRIKVVG